MPNAAEPEPPARLRALISWQVSKANTAGTRLTAARMPLTGRTDFAVLATLEEYGTLSQAELGRRLGLDRNDVSGVVGRLEESGRVDRKVDAADRRRNTIALTADGQRYLEELQAATDTVQAELASSLTPEEQELLQTLLAKLLRAHPTSSA